MQSSAQDEMQDSLRQIISSSAEDSSTVNTLIELANTFRRIDSEQVIGLAEEAKSMSERIGFQKGLANALKYIGLGYGDQNMYVEATQNWEEALKIFEQIGDKEGTSNLLGNLGTIYSNQGDDEKALNLYLRSLKIAEEIEDKMRILTVSLNIGLIYQKKPTTLDKAGEYYKVALKLSEELAYNEGIGYSSVNLGEVYFAQGDNNTALEYFEISRESLKNSGDIAYVLNNIGKVYAKRGDFEEALLIQQEAYDIADGNNSKYYMAQSLIGMANTYDTLGLIQEAIVKLKKAEPLAIQIGSKESLKEAYDSLAQYSARLIDYKSAFQYQKLLTDINDTLFKNSNEKRLNLMLMSSNLEKKESELEVQELTIQKQKIVKNAFLAGLLVILFIAFIILRNYLAKVKINKILDKQNEEIEGLLLNILPEKVAKELQEDGHATPREYESVSVLFTDFVGFSSIAKTLDPNDLVNELNSFFVAFDNITGKHNLEKIKTIGDAYMCAGGIPSPNSSHPLDTVKAGLEMQKFMTDNNVKRVADGKIPWELRVGIHTGPIVAGVVGKKKYAYDIWGSTVNIASRMESNGQAGKVNISEPTFRLIEDKYTCHHRGKISAKN